MTFIDTEGGNGQQPPWGHIPGTAAVFPALPHLSARHFSYCHYVLHRRHTLRDALESSSHLDHKRRRAVSFMPCCPGPDMLGALLPEAVCLT